MSSIEDSSPADTDPTAGRASLTASAAAVIQAATQSGLASAQLEARDVRAHFGGVQALKGASLGLRRGQLIGLIGPNGAGKTTLLNCVSGFIRLSGGSVVLDGEEITGLRPHQRASRGILRTFQAIRLFKRLTVRENVEIGARAAGKRSRGKSTQVADAILTRVGIEHLANRYAEGLSYGDQRRLELARALSAAPKFLLLDEPAAGMNEQESQQLGATIRRICAEEGCGVLLVEHDLQLIMRVCDYVYVMGEGAMISEGTARHVRADPAVITAYVGEEL